MAAKGSGILTLADVAKSKDAEVGQVAEVLLQRNPILEDIPYMEMNMETYHKEFIRGSLPEVTYRKANQPIPSSKSEIEERTFNGCHFECKSEIDVMVAERGGKLAFNRWNQAQAHIQAMGLEHADVLFNGSPEDSHLKSPGLFDVYSTVNSANSPVAANVIDALGVGSDNTSMQLVVWGPQSIFGVFPKGTKAGLQSKDNGKVQIVGTTAGGATGTYWGYQEEFMMDHALVVKDWRQGARAVNIDVSKLKDGTGVDLVDLMIDLQAKVENLAGGTPVYYVNRTLYAHLRKQVKNQVAAGGGLTFDNFGGKWVMMFDGIPVKVCDAILNNYTQVT